MLAARRRSGPRASIATGRASPSSTKTTSTTSPRCACAHARRPRCDDRRWRARAASRRVVAGSDATDHPERLPRARGAEVVILGEGEVTLRRGARRRCSGATAAALRERGRSRAARRGGRAVPYRGRARSCAISTRCRFPAWDLVDVERYRRIWRRRHGYFSMNVGDHARLSVPLQLVREADLRPALRRASPGARRRRDGLAASARTRPITSGFADDIFGLKPGLDARSSRDRGRARGGGLPFKCLCARRPADRADGASALRGAGCRDGLDRRRVGLAADPRRDGEGHPRRADRARPRGGCTRPGIEVGFFLQFGYPGETREDIETTRADGARVRARRHRHLGRRIRCPARRSSSACRRSSAAKQNWVDSDDLAMMYRGPYPHRASIAACTRSCTPSSAAAASARGGSPGVRGWAARSSMRMAAALARGRLCAGRRALPPGDPRRVPVAARPAARSDSQPSSPARRPDLGPAPDPRLLPRAKTPRSERVMRPYPPLGLLYVASHLKARGFARAVFDSTFSQLRRARGALLRASAHRWSASTAT